MEKERWLFLDFANISITDKKELKSFLKRAKFYPEFSHCPIELVIGNYLLDPKMQVSPHDKLPKLRNTVDFIYFNKKKLIELQDGLLVFLSGLHLSESAHYNLLSEEKLEIFNKLVKRFEKSAKMAEIMDGLSQYLERAKMYNVHHIVSGDWKVISIMANANHSVSKTFEVAVDLEIAAKIINNFIESKISSQEQDLTDSIDLDSHLKKVIDNFKTTKLFLLILAQSISRYKAKFKAFIQCSNNACGKYIDNPDAYQVSNIIKGSNAYCDTCKKN